MADYKKPRTTNPELRMTDATKNLSFLISTSVMDSMESSSYLTHTLPPSAGSGCKKCTTRRVHTNFSCGPRDRLLYAFSLLGAIRRSVKSEPSQEQRHVRERHLLPYEPNPKTEHFSLVSRRCTVFNG